MLSKQINHHGLAEYTSLRGRELGKPVTAMGAGDGERATVRERQLLERPNHERPHTKSLEEELSSSQKPCSFSKLTASCKISAEEEKGTIAFS